MFLSVIAALQSLREKKILVLDDHVFLSPVGRLKIPVTATL